MVHLRTKADVRRAITQADEDIRSCQIEYDSARDAGSRLAQELAYRNLIDAHRFRNSLQRLYNSLSSN